MASITKVWALDDGEKVARDDTNHWGLTSVLNACGSGSVSGNTINIFGGKNEIVAFQLILQTGSVGASAVNVSLSSLTCTTNGVNYEISNSGWAGSALVGYVAGTAATTMTGYWDYVGRHIELFVASYMYIPNARVGITNNDGEGAAVFHYNNRPAASGDPRCFAEANYFVGHYIPDALCPIEAPSGNAAGQVFSEGVKGGAPFFINPNQTQTVWADIYVPRYAPTGTYQGVIKVTEGGNPVSSLPISLQVYNFTVTDNWHLKQSWQFEGALIQNTAKSPASASPTTSNGATWEYLGRHAKLFKRHMANLRPVLDELYWELPGTIKGPGRPYLEGQTFTSLSGYDGPGASGGENIYLIGVYDEGDGLGYSRTWHMDKAGFATSSQADYQSAANTWVGIERSLTPYSGYTRPDFYYYSADEPPVSIQAVKDCIRQKIGWMRASAGAGSAIKTYQTIEAGPNMNGIADYGGPLTGYIDQFLPLSKFGSRYMGDGYPFGFASTAAPIYRSWIPTADTVSHFEVGTYNGGQRTQGAGFMEGIDAQAIEARVMGWHCWKYAMDSYFQWTISYRDGGDTHGDANWNRDVWLYGAPSGWGGGFVVYEGENYQVAADDHNIPGPISCIRLKNWRRGMQDYEYLYALSGQSATTSIVNSVCTGQFDDIVATYPGAIVQGGLYNQPVGFSERGFDYESARKQLAQLLDSGTPPVVNPSSFMIFFS